MSLSQKAKSAGGYLLTGTQISLQFLQSFDSLIPVPFVQVAIGASCQLITIAQAIQSNVKSAGLLADRVIAIMLVILTPLERREAKDISDDLKTSLSRLTKDLCAIEIDAQRIKKRTDTTHIPSIIKATLNYGDNADSLRLAQIAIMVKDVGMGVQGVQNGVKEVHLDVKDIQTAVHGIANRIAAHEHSLPSTAIPPKAELIYGRHNDIEDIVSRILAHPATRYGVLGPGGIGKTSVVSAVMQHPDTVKHLGSRRYWAPCEQASSLELLQGILSKAFRIEDGSSDRMQAILSLVEADTRQHLIVLDTVCTLSGVSNLTILITMRGSLPETTRMRWTLPELSPLAGLSPDAARRLFTQVSAGSGSDPALDSLLAALDYVPLAVTLMAKVGSEGETPTELLDRWRKEGTELVHERGGDRRTSVSKSIELSLRSNLTENNPDALVLLSVLVVLLDGARPDIIPGLVPSIPSPSKARAVLVRASLVYTGVQHQFSVSSPHILSPQALEEIILEEVLLHVLRYRPSIPAVEAAYRFSYYLYWTSPRSNVILVAVETLKDLGSQYWLAWCLALLGDIRLKQNQHDDAESHAKSSRQVALEAGIGGLAARCLGSLADIEGARNRYDEARHTSKEAQTEYTEFGDKAGALRCLVAIADMDTTQGRFRTARIAYQSALEQENQRGDSFQFAYCQSKLAGIDCAQGYYDDARTGAQEALVELERLSSTSHAAQCLSYLARIDLGQEHYDDARVAAEKARQEFDRLGDRNKVIVCCLVLVKANIGQERYDDARTLLLAAKAEGAESVESSLSWGQLYQRLGQFAEARSALREARSEFEKYGHEHATAEYLMDGRLHDSRCALKEAEREFERMGMRKEITGCKTSLGEIDLKEGWYNEARANLEQARGVFEEMGTMTSLARCISLLDDVPSTVIEETIQT
ncbi:hypothetical protein FRB96_006370 [Tulasnella sp. 330]|nr:hypothetical protein FRB96_006370 [Tulasnella sp. 330]